MQQSPTIDKLVKSLIAARKDFKKVIKSSDNPYFKSKYADLNELIEATEPALSANGLVIIQSPGKFDNNALELTTLLIHESGEFVFDTMTIPVTKADAQGVGSATTYARRYAYGAFLNLAADDDDGNSAVGNSNPSSVNRPAKERKPQPTKEEKTVEGLPTPEDKKVYIETMKRFKVEREDLKNFLLRFTGAENINKISDAQWKKVIEALDNAEKYNNLEKLVKGETSVQ